MLSPMRPIRIPLEAMTQSTAHWSERVIRGSPTSRGGSPYALQKRQCGRGQRALLQRRSAASKVIHGHNEGFWPLDKAILALDYSRVARHGRHRAHLKELDFGQSEMSRKIARDKMNNPSSRGPLAAAKKLHSNAGYKVKYANGSKFPPPVKPLADQSVAQN